MSNFFDGYTASAYRSMIVLLILFPVAIFSKSLRPVNLKQNWRYILGMLVASAITWGPLYYAILHAGIGISLTVAYASIVIGQFFFGWLWAGEHFSKDKALSVALGFVGLVLMFSPTNSNLAGLALLAAFVSGISTAANTVFAKQIKYNATQSTIVLWVTSLIANFFMAVALRKPEPTFGWHVQWLYLIFFGVASVIASWSLVKGVKLIDAGAAGILGLLEIVFGVLFGMVFFGEHPGPVVLVGMMAIIAAAVVPYFKSPDAPQNAVV